MFAFHTALPQQFGIRARTGLNGNSHHVFVTLTDKGLNGKGHTSESYVSNETRLYNLIQPLAKVTFKLTVKPSKSCIYIAEVVFSALLIT